MAVHIRLQRKGGNKKPFYHIVATDHRSARDGRFIEKLGYYDPNCEPSLIEIKGDRIQHWFSRGAQLSPTLEKIVKIKKLPVSRQAPTA